MRYDDMYGKPESPQMVLSGMDDRGERDLKEAEGWIRENPDAWHFMVSKAHQWARTGTVSINLLVGLTRQEKRVSIKNGLAPTFARIMRRDHPELEGCLKTHRAYVDGHVA